MERFITFLAPVLLFIAPPLVQGQSNAVNDSNLAVVHGYLDAVTQSDVELMKYYLHPEKLSYCPTRTDTANYDRLIQKWQKNASILSHMQYNTTQYITLTVEKGTWSGEWVYIWGTVRGFHQPRDRWVEFENHIVTKIEDQKIVYIAEYYNPMEYLQKLGYRLQSPRSTRDIQQAEKSEAN